MPKPKIRSVEDRSVNLGIPIAHAVRTQIIKMYETETIGSIAKELNIHRDTVKKYLKMAKVY